MRYRYWVHYLYFVKESQQSKKFTGRIQIQTLYPIMSMDDVIGVEEYIKGTIPPGAILDVDDWKLLAYRDDENAEWKPVLS